MHFGVHVVVPEKNYRYGFSIFNFFFRTRKSQVLILCTLKSVPTAKNSKMQNFERNLFKILFRHPLYRKGKNDG
jgi:hypothetical protein